ncbi:hypothetical protein AFCDBAGC_5043 [Methylobacterium cerastii]|uniref:XRE family transcriptional regulator n=1 Tax=Methylobacterium cerastii TaxID=932741 RepID=A0ABQ4QPH3_9HYPH|nr:MULTISPECIES: hypothetical protein [Methylobacterium]TXM64262.1 hypothetical protein FV226_26740 [Methylobacterium sp. WL12]TXM97075.1 hypothetical protein FV222_16770 [Methylobacterium sp. WL103]GJD47157.1 hypothetical protein AFCDBAGC_5043 [Methylobacterium cerastii]
MQNGSDLGDGSDVRDASLRRLAEALDIAPTAFFDETSADLDQTTELLRLWQGIRNTQDRAKVLSMVQAMVRTIATRA